MRLALTRGLVPRVGVLVYCALSRYFYDILKIQNGVVTEFFSSGVIVRSIWFSLFETLNLFRKTLVLVPETRILFVALGGGLLQRLDLGLLILHLLLVGLDIGIMHQLTVIDCRTELRDDVWQFLALFLKLLLEMLITSLKSSDLLPEMGVFSFELVANCRPARLVRRHVKARCVVFKALK